ncbi:MAG: hypothetical protein KKA79_01245 [Nanoarchaeota archaeon]|nr:hypothetical protein [Nanoarchaeota archaeon]MCG2717518.1 hypothetical protein [Nanoarchaeota archaeon]
MKKHFVERINERQERNCKSRCADFVRNNIDKYSLKDIEDRLCCYCGKSIFGVKRIRRYIGNHPNI